MFQIRRQPFWCYKAILEHKVAIDLYKWDYHNSRNIQENNLWFWKIISRLDSILLIDYISDVGYYDIINQLIWLSLNHCFKILKLRLMLVD